MKKIQFWMPFAFCALISLMALFSSVPNNASGWQITFLAFLPMCFFYAGAVMFGMNKEILQLRARINEIEKNHSEI